MKKLFSSILILILLLNVMGYYGVFIGLQYRNDVAMTRALDADQYEESHSITIKVPIAIPYLNDQTEFERVEGKFEHQGELYRVVKQRYAQDTLTVICIKDTENKLIEDAMSDFVKTFSDKCGDEQQNAKLTIGFIKDYIAQNFSIAAISSGWQIDVANTIAQSNLIPSFMPSVVHPPERG